MSSAARRMLVVVLTTGLFTPLVMSAPAAALPPDWGAAETALPSTVEVEALDMAVDSHGRVVVVYHSGRPGTVHAVTRERGGAWGQPVTLGSGSHPRVGAGASGHVVAAWGDGSTVRSALLAPGATSWSSPETVAPLDGSASQVRLAVAPSGRAAVAWVDTDGPRNRTVMAALRSPGGTWTEAEQLWTGTAFNGAAVEPVHIGSDRFSAVVSVSEDATPYDTTLLLTADTDGDSWGAATQHASVRGSSVQLQAGSSADGTAGVSIRQWGFTIERVAANALSAMVRSPGGSWSAPVEQYVFPYNGAVGRGSGAVAAGEDGRVSVAWLEGDDGHALDYQLRLRTATHAGGIWSHRTHDTAQFDSTALGATPDGEHLLGVVERHETGPFTVSGTTMALETGWGSLAEVGSGNATFGDYLHRLVVGQDGTAAHVWRATEDGGLRAVVSEGAGLQLDLSVFGEDGEPISGELAPGQYIEVVVTLANNSDETLDLTFEGGAPLVVDPRSPGGLDITGIPEQVPDSLAAGEEVRLVHELTASERGVAATNTKVTASGASIDAIEAKASLRFDIELGSVVDEALGQILVMQVIDRYLVQAVSEWHQAMERRAAALRRQLQKTLPKKLFRRWVSGGVSAFETAQAYGQGVAPELVDARLPGKKFKGHTVEELNSAYDKAFLDEVGSGVKEWAKGWKRTGKKAKRIAEDAYGEALLASFWMLGNATPEERMEFEAKMVQFAENNQVSARTIVDTVKKEVPRYQENGTYFAEALEMSLDDVLLRSPDLAAQLAQEKKARKNILALADKDPVAFQRKWAKRDAEIFNLGVPLILDTILGAGVSRVGGVKIKGPGAGVVNTGEVLGVVKNGKAVRRPTTSVPPSGSPAPGANARTTERFLADVDGATMVRSNDAGNVYELPNTGGVPEITLDVKAGILKELETEYLAKTGNDVTLVEVLKPSSPVRKPGGVAKLELTSQKTGKSAMLDAGAPEEVFGEASVWTSTQHPSTIKGFNKWSAARRAKAIDEYHVARKRWDEWKNPEPGSKTARLQECIGKRSTVPLDLEPNQAGIQRFVTAEFETVPVRRGKARGELIRVKHYEIEFRVDGRVVNRKTVIDSSSKALPQTPDADAVAVAKQVGTDSAGRPILEPLSRAEREFVMQRYIDKNIKARRSGLMPDAAEHGATLIMDDVSAVPAGKLLANYGVPFLPEGAGTAYLARIAKYVAPPGVTPDEMLQKLLRIVQSEGGFGQHAVVVTKDSRYLGDLNVAQW